MSGFLWVCVGAAVGAPARYLVDRAIQARHDTVMPWGTLAVNIVASFLLGLMAGLATTRVVPDPIELLLGSGFCGALSTYSTFGYETFRLFEEGAHLLAAANVAGNLVGGLSAAGLGWWLGTGW